MVRIQPIMGHEKGFMERSFQFDKLELRNMYTDLLKMKEEAEVCFLRKDKLPSYAEERLAEERAKREEAEREKELLEQKCKELQQKLDNQERVLKQLQAEMEERMRNELRERDEKIQKLE
ncbi:guanylate-binding protein 4-like, partial [Equus quagga]|uniref:guanylate-binding protein 4-like n=1 Tax=Equus quagga TaxID=89248 RepID=UPI001EE2A9F9